MQVVRSCVIDAPVDAVYQLMTDYREWKTWSPWLVCEPGATVTISDPPDKVGSIYEWSGSIIGAGRIKHAELRKNEWIEDNLQFLKPFKSNAIAQFQFVERNAKTELTWKMESKLPFFMFWFKGMMEGMIGMDFDRGLLMIKDRIERGEIPAKSTVVGKERIGPLHMVGLRQTSSLSKLSADMSSAFGNVDELLKQSGLETNSEMITVYHKFNCRKEITFEYTAGRVCKSLPTSLPAGLVGWSLPATSALRVDHHGAYHLLGNAWSSANAYLRHKKWKQSKVGAFELYKNDPSSVPESELLTQVFLPLK